MKRFLSISLFAGLFVFALAFGAQAQCVTKDKEMMDKEKMPIVAVIKADWCPYCENVEPVMMKLMNDYGQKLKFVVFDVTNDETTKEAMKTAEELGLTKFFKENKRKTSAVAVIKDEKIVFKTFNNTKREDYVKAFDSALN
ncbi:MAG: thioredoxin domain-containing protein [Pyrinomonadaceae bacterium]